jgi:hypothetical protein
VRDAEQAIAVDQRQAVERADPGGAQDLALDERDRGARRDRDRPALARDPPREALADLHDQADLALAAEPERSAHAEHIVFADQDRGRIDGGGELDEHLEQAPQQIVEAPALQRLGRDAIEREERAIARSREAIHRCGHGLVDREVDRAQLLDVPGIHDALLPEPHDAVAQDRELADDLRQIEAFIEADRRVQIRFARGRLR